MNQGIERRRHRRIYFTAEDGVFAVIEMKGTAATTLSTNLLSLSEGGVSFIAQKEIVSVASGNHVLLVRVFEPESLQFLHEVPMEIRHTITDSDMPHVVCGCEFKQLPDDQLEKIREFVRVKSNN